jgi:GTP-binding protein EngB required for normal cell division
MSDSNANGTPRTRPNVILFGESGAGKSSIINMLVGDQDAVVSDQATGVTFSISSYRKTINGSSFTIFDTIGLNEGSRGTVKARDAVRRLYNLICRLDDGVNLLVYVMQQPRIKQTAELNYKLFYEIFCQTKVPIGIAITGLEHRDNMDEWWEENKSSFQKYGMKFAGHACITTIKGRSKNGEYCYQKEYDESKQAVENLIAGLCQMPWKMERGMWFREVLDGVLGIFELKLDDRRNQLARALQKYGGMSRMAARAEAKKIESRRIGEEKEKQRKEERR